MMRTPYYSVRALENIMPPATASATKKPKLSLFFLAVPSVDHMDYRQTADRPQTNCRQTTDKLQNRFCSPSVVRLQSVRSPILPSLVVVCCRL